MRTLPSALFLAVLALPGSIVACNGKGSGDTAAASATSSAPASSATSSASAAAAAANASAAAFAAKGRSRHHVGLAGALLRGAYELDLDDAQRATLEKTEDELSADKDASPWGAIKALNTDIVAGIRASKMDNAKLQTDYAAVDKAVLAARAHEAKALDALHGLLTPAQRQTLATQVKAHHTPKHPLGPDGGALDMAKMRLVRLSVQLGLDDAQKKSVAAVLAKDPGSNFAAMQARHEATQKALETLLDAFQKDPFDASTLELDPGGAKTPHETMQRHAEFTAALLPILHPDQREKLAVQTERQGNRPTRSFEDSEPGPPSMMGE